ncbi:hypothetical protein [Actinoallomurus soli]|uniref:hypothetical protein n=1 Tax=Actinoallomurus soli TaxID=2952535 RepID=UPI0020930391|nr:hypothetical protein [Actinoallomurus soli]MCO5968743.1 hypothetical protein [Actinoallomurus soli]
MTMMTFDIPQAAGSPQIGRHAAPAADPLGALASAPAVVRPSWIALSVSRTSVAKARRFAAEVIRDHVTDPDPRPLQVNPAPTNGWGLGIVDTYAVARWVTYTDTDKTVHVLITAPGVTLLPGEVDIPEVGPPSNA